MNKIKKILLVTAMAFGLSSFGLVLAPTTTNAQFKDQVCQGVGLTNGSADCGSADPNDPNSAQGTVARIISQVINIMSILVGVMAVIMIIISGIRFITSGGDPNNVGAAKNTIIYAIVGLVVVAMSQVIVRFVLTRF